MDKDIKNEFENLARIVQGGFLELKEEISSVRSELKEDIAILDVKVSRIDQRTENQVDSLYGDMHALKDRVKVVEEKIGIVPPKTKLVAA